MYEEAFAIGMVVALGLIIGGGAGLLIGYLAKTQGPGWAVMTRRNRLITTALVCGCSAIVIAGLSWRFLLQ